MFDLIVLFTLFLGLVGILGLFHQWQASRTYIYRSPSENKNLLFQWLESHKLSLPDTQSIFSVLNRRLQEIESKEWEKLELTNLLPRTELPVFNLSRVEISTDNRNITLWAKVEWPMCLPGVGVSVWEKGAEQAVKCNFMIDWLIAQIRVRLTEKNGILMLSYENLEPIRMAVACSIADGSAKDPENLPSAVADTLQQMLMDLQLDRVPLVSLYGHTPSVPLVLVSSPEETTSASHDQDKATPTDTDSIPSNDETIGPISMADEVITMTPTLEEVEPIPEEVKTSQASIKAATTEPELTNGSPPNIEETAGSIAPQKQVQNNSSASTSSVPPPLLANNTTTIITTTTPSSPISPGLKRNTSYEQLQEIPMGFPKDKHPPSPSTVNLIKKKRANSSEHLASPTRAVSSPLGKGMTLSMAGSEAESIYGADDRVPSTLIFEVTESGYMRHIVALNTSHASKLRRHYTNAKKLHIYNDHSFVASHLKNRVDCGVCKEKISKLFGKQGYVCQDCGLTVHKQCHYKTEDHCPSSSVSSMNLSYEDKPST